MFPYFIKDVIRLTEAMASSIVIYYPFMGFIGTMVDDLREYPITAYLECLTLFWVNYRLSRKLNLLEWK